MTDREDFCEVYRRNVRTVYQTAYMHLRNRNDAEDAVQNIFLKYITAKPVLESLQHEKAWFIVTARNYCRDQLKSWWRKKRTETEGEEQFYEQFESDDDYEMTEILMKLPDSYREILYLYYYQEYTIKEIAGITGQKENAVKTRLCRARDKIKKILEKEEEPYEQEGCYQAF